MFIFIVGLAMVLEIAFLRTYQTVRADAQLGRLGLRYAYFWGIVLVDPFLLITSN